MSYIYFNHTKKEIFIPNFLKQVLQSIKHNNDFYIREVDELLENHELIRFFDAWINGN